MTEKEHSIPRVIIAGGGTGGHLFPGVAVAKEICRRKDRAKIGGIGTWTWVEICYLIRSSPIEPQEVKKA